MSMLSWNCRGTGRSLQNSKMQHLSRLVSSTQAQVIFVSETRNAKITATQLNNHFSVSDSFVVPSIGLSGGLWVMWTDEVRIEIINSSQYYVFASVVQISTNVSFNLICMYGDPHHKQTNHIWQDVTAFVIQNHDRPTFCMGDLNNIMHPNEKWGPAPPCLSRINNFCALVKQCGLIDLGYSGLAYTWTNKRFTTNPTFERLDRCLANADWCQMFPTTSVYHLPMLYSDHAPILAIFNSSMSKPKRRFKFENWWFSEDDFHETAAQSWAQTSTRPFHKRTQNHSSSIKAWVKKKKPLNQQLAETEEQLLQIQKLPPNLIDHSKEADLTHLHNSLLDKITEHYRQLSKKHWATKGDRNTRFFQRACTRRRQKNRILFISSRNNTTISNPEDIAQEFITFFSDLFASTLPPYRQSFSHEVTITNEFTNSTPSIDECLQILKEMRLNAAPGPDGYCAYSKEIKCPSSY
ncbi:hypothetical protein BS78_10G069200 [Paspalum vaginatum]|nr:hypothetical protein BS78_10G069200 [Paspalum vaginatum]